MKRILNPKTRWFYLLCFAVAASAFGAEKETITLSNRGLFARYVAEPNPLKPYIKELYSRSGVQVLLDSPPDHVHHHGLMFGIGAGATDFWAEKPAEKFGRQVPRGKVKIHSFDSQTSPSEHNTWFVEQTLDWLAPDGKPQLAETRTIMAHRWYDCRILTWATELTPISKTEPVKLWGSHYFGLGLRLAPDMNDKVRFIFPAGTPPGQVVRGDERLTSATWCAAAGEIGGKPVTIVMWDESDDNWPTTVWFTMAQPFAYVSATLDLTAHPQTLAPGAKLSRHYGVAVFDGIADLPQIEKTVQLKRSTYLRGIDGGPLYGKR